MTPAELARRHPRLFHLTDPDAMDGIRRRGLWPTSRLLDLFEVEADARRRLEHRRRPRSEILTHPEHGRVTITDNLPLSEVRLAGVLDDGLTVADWMAVLNRRVFFWADERRLQRLQNARENRDRPRTLLIFDTLSLATRYAEGIEIAAFNTGATVHQTPRRGLSTFTPLGRYSHADWSRLRGRVQPDLIAEVTVTREMPDVMDFHIETRIIGE